MLGLLGGTFDPPHNGHIALARAGIAKLHLGKVIFIPANIPPHKNPEGISSPEHRIAMLRLALESRPEFEISMVEFDREGPSFSVETVRYFRKTNPAERIYFLIGADNVAEMESWFEPDGIFDLATVAAADRTGFSPRGRFESKILRIDMEPVDISSTEIRNMIRSGRDISGLVHPAVERYIIDNRLYKNDG